jgi:RNA polymerase primary sigma factor
MVEPLQMGEPLMTRIVETWTASAVDVYLAEIGRYPLLSADQEIMLARQYERGREARCELDRVPAADVQERQRLEQDVRQGDQARRRMIECNMRLVVSVTKRYLHLGLPLGDLIQEGSIGLMEAVERYDHRRGLRFATYAVWWIRQSIHRALASQASAVHLPLWAHEALCRLRKQRDDLEVELGRRPTLEELAAQMGTSTRRIRRLMRWDQQVVSLQAPASDTGDDEVADWIRDRQRPPVEDALLRHLLPDIVRHALADHLEPRDQGILRRRFGLDDDRRWTLEEVAQEYGITRQRVSQIEARALQRLRYTRALRDFGES